MNLEPRKQDPFRAFDSLGAMARLAVFHLFQNRQVLYATPHVGLLRRGKKPGFPVEIRLGRGSEDARSFTYDHDHGSALEYACDRRKRRPHRGQTIAPGERRYRGIVGPILDLGRLHLSGFSDRNHD